MGAEGVEYVRRPLTEFLCCGTINGLLDRLDAPLADWGGGIDRAGGAGIR